MADLIKDAMAVYNAEQERKGKEEAEAINRRAAAQRAIMQRAYDKWISLIEDLFGKEYTWVCTGTDAQQYEPAGYEPKWATFKTGTTYNEVPIKVKDNAIYWDGWYMPYEYKPRITNLLQLGRLIKDARDHWDQEMRGD